MTEIFKVTRRRFLRDSGLGAGALVLGWHVLPKEAEAARAAGATFQPNSYVAIRSDGSVVLVAHRSEMGQGIRSSLPAVLADELEADWSRVTIQQADAAYEKFGVENPIPGGKPKHIVRGNEAQFTDSSRSMAAYFQVMRTSGAAAKLMLIGAAAQVLGVDASELSAKDHRVTHGASGRSLGYGELAAVAATQPVPSLQEIQGALKTPDQWKFITKKMPFFDSHDMCSGKAVYGADVTFPGMLTAMIERCPVANGEVKSFDDTETRKVEGVVDVVKVRLPGDLPAGGVGAGFMPHAGVAVVAENTWAAWKGRRALKVEWDYGPIGSQFASETFNSPNFRQLLQGSTSKKEDKAVRERGDVDAAFATSVQTVEASYYVPYLAQAPMEPPAAVARYDPGNGSWEIWSPTQGPQITQQYVGLAMLRENPIEWLAWEEPEIEEGECGYEQEQAFQQTLQAVMGLSKEQLEGFREQLKKEVRDKVTVHVTLLGGGFGRKSKPDYAVEAAFLAREFPGRHVRVQWTREDDIKFSYYNAAAHQYLKAGLDADGKTTAWLHRSAYPSFFATLFPPPNPLLPEPVNKLFASARAAFKNGGEFPYSSAIERAHGLEEMPYDVPNIRVENCQAPSHIRGGWMRSVANIYHGFALGSFVDEVARAAGRDTKDYLIDLIGEGKPLDLPADKVACFDNNQFPLAPRGTPVPVVPGYPVDPRRLRGVIERVAKEADWDNRIQNLPKGRGLGIAAHRSFLTYVATVIDASLDEINELTIHEIWCAMDCGVPVNPDRILAQIEGGIVYGLTLALHGEITIKDGAVEQNNFDDYPMLRLYQTPKINSYIHTDWPAEYQGQAPPTGVGEPPVPQVAPALCNAIAAAGGPRIREIPVYKFVGVA